MADEDIIRKPWLCPEGHVISDPSRVGTCPLFREHQTLNNGYIQLRPLEDFPALYSAWVLGGLEAVGLLWKAGCRC